LLRCAASPASTAGGLQTPATRHGAMRNPAPVLPARRRPWRAARDRMDGMAHPLRPNHLPHPHGPLPWLPGLLHEPASTRPGAGTRLRTPRPRQHGASGFGAWEAGCRGAIRHSDATQDTASRHAPGIGQSTTQRPAVCGVRRCVLRRLRSCAHSVPRTSCTTNRSTAPTSPGASPHHMQPQATSNRQPASTAQGPGRCGPHRFHRPAVGKSNSSLTVMVRSNNSSTICGPETFDKHDPDIDTNLRSPA